MGEHQAKEKVVLVRKVKTGSSRIAKESRAQALEQMPWGEARLSHYGAG